MKIYISADIEGVTGIAAWDEATLSHADNGEFRERMTAEAAAACEGALAAGATEIVVKDAHATGRNLLAERLPREARLVRGWSGHPYCMVQEIDSTFAAAVFIGWHSAGGRGGNPLAHTLSSGRLGGIKVNGELASEFLLHAHAAALEGVPVAFVSGDEDLCGEVGRYDERITTVTVGRGVGASCVSRHPAVTREEIRAGVEAALGGDLRAMCPALPKSFSIEVIHRHADEAYRRSFYPGAELREATTVAFETDDWFEALRAIRFIA